MNYQIRAFQLSLVVHAAAIILLIVAGNPFVSERKKLLVVDFTLSDTSGPHHELLVMTDRKQESRGRKTEIARAKQEHPVPEPETLPPLKQEAVPVIDEVQQVSPTTARIAAVIQNEKITEVENSRKPESRSTSSGYGSDNSPASGSDTKGISTGDSDSSYKTAGTGYLKSNFSYIRDMIIKGTIYPERARQMGWQGRVKVSFVISSDGFVKDIRILESSGVEILDKNAVETVKKASPFPKPPVAAQLIIPISYRLH